MSNYSEWISRAYFVKLDIENAPVYVNSSGVSLYWDGQEYLGVGSLGEISGLGDNTDMSAAQITLGISGIPIENINDLSVNDYQERSVHVWQNDLDRNHQVISSQLMWAGRMDTADVELGSTAMIQMRCESALARWNRASPRRMNHQHQQILYPDDYGLQYVAASENVSITL